MRDVTLVIPAKFEADSLPYVLEELKRYPVKKIIVMPKSDIMTFKVIKKYNCKIIFQKNAGYGSALIQGILSVKSKYFCIRAEPIITPSALVFFDISSTSFLDFIPNPTKTGIFDIFFRDLTFLMISL